MDTAQYLQRTNGLISFTVAVSSRDSIPLKVTQFCNPYVLRLKHYSSKQQPHRQRKNCTFWGKMSNYDNSNPDEAVESCWCVERKGPHRGFQLNLEKTYIQKVFANDIFSPHSRATTKATASTGCCSGSIDSMVVQYALVRSIKDDPRIVWKKMGYSDNEEKNGS